MHPLFDFRSNDIQRWRDLLVTRFGGLEGIERRSPIAQLIKSLISGRTRDPVSAAAETRLHAAFPSIRAIARAKAAAVEHAIAAVTFADNKAEQLVEALRIVESERDGFDLDFLATMPMEDALAWLERLPGVGRKVAASVMNASTIERPVFIADSHILRVLQRLRFVPMTADFRVASEEVTASVPSWSAHDFLEFHVVTKELGQRICRPEQPDCGRCPLALDCPSRSD